MLSPEPLSNPVDPAADGYSIEDIVDIDRLRGLFENFSKCTGFTTGLVSFPDQKLLIATGWRDICTAFHRCCPSSSEHCHQSNIELTARLKDLRELNIMPCGNGLVDGATPVIIRGRHLASLATGQVLLAKPDRDRFVAQAKEHGYGVDAYLAALDKVPVVTEEQIKQALTFLSELAAMIAEQGLANLQLREAAESLVDARRRAESASMAKSEFLAVMSHEMRTPLNGVIGNCDLLGLTDLTDEQRESLEAVSASGENLLGLLDSLIDFSRIEADKVVLCVEQFSPSELLDSVCAILRPRATDKGLSLICRPVENLPALVSGDSFRIKQILTNIVGNAIKFTDAGAVTVSSSLAAAPDAWEFTVSDTGIGLSQDEIARIFEPFTQIEAYTKRIHHGSGVGLVICARLAKLMGGTISVASTPSQGSSFTCMLPLGIQSLGMPDIVDPMPQHFAASKPGFLGA